MDAVFFKIHKLLDRLAPDRIAGRRAQILMKRCLTAELVILDVFAFRAYSQRETELLYAICDERLSSGSIIVTSGRSYRKGEHPGTQSCPLDGLPQLA
jgi:DNA replication protein DnaC